MITELLMIGLAVHAPVTPAFSVEQMDTHAPSSRSQPSSTWHPDLPPVFDAVIDCESEGNPTARNPVSSASGIAQFIDSTWSYVWIDYLGESAPTARAYQATLDQQLRATVALYEREGLRPWECARILGVTS